MNQDGNDHLRYKVDAAEDRQQPARRDPEVARHLASARVAFREFVSRRLESIVHGPTAHVAGLFALVEGLTMAQVLHPADRLSRAELQAEILLWLGGISTRRP